jgi:hypothetical protein
MGRRGGRIRKVEERWKVRGLEGEGAHEQLNPSLGGSDKQKWQVLWQAHKNLEACSTGGSKVA